VVLAGGRDSRLGGEGKATVEVAGRPLLAYVLEAMTSPPVALWTEPDEPRHPLAGLPSRA